MWFTAAGRGCLRKAAGRVSAASGGFVQPHGVWQNAFCISGSPAAAGRQIWKKAGMDENPEKAGISVRMRLHGGDVEILGGGF